MPTKDKINFELIEQLQAHLLPPDGDPIDIGKCRAIASEIEIHLKGVREWVGLGSNLYQDFRNSLISRSKAIEALLGEKGITSESVDSLDEAGLDPQKLFKLRNRIEREFNRVFRNAPSAINTGSIPGAPDLSDFKSG
ncbi:MAG: hypothetical protein CO189_07705 [candidate division Zixibacteria bacterium CG_4_9_14_3_um_filter_46_8]|nr:MAG: hypothetical protein CO189_07705 [candidate division Zixibacteria bacterium CG_4_9_14_3_um_filter_46_8]